VGWCHSLPKQQAARGSQELENPADDHYIDNFGLSEIIVGYCQCFPVVKMVSESSELQQELERQIAAKELQEANK